MDTDYHIHTASSDGPTLHSIREAAIAEGLREVGIVDHCNVSPYNDIGYGADMFDTDEFDDPTDAGYFRENAPFRREAVDEFVQDSEQFFTPDQQPVFEPYGPMGEEVGVADGGDPWLEMEPGRRPVTVWRGIEMDYEPDSERFVEAYLDFHDFDFSIGSVHYLDDSYVPKERNFPDTTGAEAEEMTETYFDKMVSLVESEIFDILAHPGLIERNPVFEPYVVRSHYEDVADALRNSSTVTEINGKSLERQDAPYPVDVFHEEGVSDFTTGTDTHRSREIAERSGLVDAKLEELDLEPVGSVDALTPQNGEVALRERAL